MGSILSNLSTQSVAVVVIVVSAVSYTVVQHVLFTGPTQEVTSTPGGAAADSSAAGKKGKKKKAVTAQSDTAVGASAHSGVKPIVVPFPSVIPGSFESPAVTSEQEQADVATKPSKSKKKKAKKSSTPVIGGGTRSVPLDAQSESSATAPESHAPTSKPAKKKSPTPKPPTMSLVDTDDTWTRVETRRRGNQSPSAAHSRDTSGALGSDAGLSTSVTGNSSPVNERTEDESRLQVPENRRTLAERLLPKARKTGVDDMLETPDHPTLSRVMRIQPRADERPAEGFSWGDYEDVDEPRTADDADGEDEGGWVTKTSKARAKPTRTASSEQQAQTRSSAPESLSKKQRQNAAKNEAKKSAKADAEAERLALLAKHKRELERTRMLEQSASSKASKVGGGMNASINESGHLVWD
ncbi:hypothetical protein EUX98_g5356 [Antrodiella citrinella]|uniref:Uncharacterized protein n=1 Tax=Antrodiella citrinella TaxID=2447956 RepID=A0A4S4MU41_9APHY|nr:hypothetical protein EUX98_g5356 [Antrodiella citrinella]